MSEIFAMIFEALPDKNRKTFDDLGAFSDDFYLAGGTALALQIGHRISVDFDLFSDKEIPASLLQKINRLFDRKRVEVSVNNPEELTVFIDEVKITFLQYPFPLVFEPVRLGNIRALSIKEIAATKAYTIGRRGSFKDYVDLFFIISEAHGSLEDIVALAEKKYGNEFNSRLFLEQLTYLDDVDDFAIIFLKRDIGKSDLQSFFDNEVRKLAF